MLKSTGKEGRPNFQLDCDKFAAEQLRQKHVSNVYRLTREERLRIMDPDYEERQRASTGFVLDGERYANSNPRTKEAFPYKPFFRQNENSDDPSSADSGRRRRRRGRRRPAGTVGYDVSSADLKRKLEFDKARPRIDAQGQVIKHEPKKVITYKLPDYSKVSSKIGQSATSPYKRHGGNVRVKFGVAKKRNLPPLTPAAPDREATYLRRKELLREYTRKLDPSGTSPEKRRSPGRGPQPDGGASPTHHSNKQRREQHGSDSGSTTGPNTTTHAATSSNRSGENDEYSRHNDVRRATDQTPASPESPTTINDHKDADVHASSYANVAAHGNSNDDDDDDDDDDDNEDTAGARADLPMLEVDGDDVSTGDDHLRDEEDSVGVLSDDLDDDDDGMAIGPEATPLSFAPLALELCVPTRPGYTHQTQCTLSPVGVTSSSATFDLGLPMHVHACTLSVSAAAAVAGAHGTKDAIMTTTAGATAPATATTAGLNVRALLRAHGVLTGVSSPRQQQQHNLQAQQQHHNLQAQQQEQQQQQRHDGEESDGLGGPAALAALRVELRGCLDHTSACTNNATATMNARCNASHRDASATDSVVSPSAHVRTAGQPTCLLWRHDDVQVTCTRHDDYDGGGDDDGGNDDSDTRATAADTGKNIKKKKGTVLSSPIASRYAGRLFRFITVRFDGAHLQRQCDTHNAATTLRGVENDSCRVHLCVEAFAAGHLAYLTPPHQPQQQQQQQPQEQSQQQQQQQPQEQQQLSTWLPDDQDYHPVMAALEEADVKRAQGCVSCAGFGIRRRNTGVDVAWQDGVAIEEDTSTTNIHNQGDGHGDTTAPTAVVVGDSGGGDDDDDDDGEGRGVLGVLGDWTNMPGTITCFICTRELPLAAGLKHIPQCFRATELKFPLLGTHPVILPFCPIKAFCNKKMGKRQEVCQQVDAFCFQHSPTAKAMWRIKGERCCGFYPRSASPEDGCCRRPYKQCPAHLAWQFSRLGLLSKEIIAESHQAEVAAQELDRCTTRLSQQHLLIMHAMHSVEDIPASEAAPPTADPYWKEGAESQTSSEQPEWLRRREEADPYVQDDTRPALTVGTKSLPKRHWR